MAIAVPIVVEIDDSSDKTISGVYTFDRSSGGILKIPSGSTFPDTPEAGELFWKTDESRLYRRNDANDDWEPAAASVEAHASSHQNGGSDEINVAGLSGELADPQPVKQHGLGDNTKHSQTTLADLNALVSDATLDDQSDSRPPTAHASSHQAGGGDELAHDTLSGAGSQTHAQLDAHIASTANPHTVTASQVGKDTAQWNADRLQGTPIASAAPADGQVLRYNETNSQYEPADQSSSSTFGSQFQQETDDSETQTTSTSYVQRLRMTTPSLPSGTYRVGWYYEWQVTGLTDYLARIQVNDTTNIVEVREEAVDAGSNQWFPRSGFGYFTGFGVLNIDLDYAVPTNSVKMRRARLEIWRVS